jgi:hypothetical protein
VNEESAARYFVAELSSSPATPGALIGTISKWFCRSLDILPGKVVHSSKKKTEFDAN